VVRGPLVFWSFISPVCDPLSRRPLPGTLASTLSLTPSSLWLSFLGTLGTLARFILPPAGWEKTSPIELTDFAASIFGLWPPAKASAFGIRHSDLRVHRPLVAAS
jgi:hypothetical protein